MADSNLNIDQAKKELWGELTWTTEEAIEAPLMEGNITLKQIKVRADEAPFMDGKVTRHEIKVTAATPDVVDELHLPSFLSNNSILPIFSDDSTLPPFRPRSYSTTVLVHRQVAQDLRMISDSFNSLYHPNSASLDLSDEELHVAQQMSRRSSMPNIGRQRKSSLLGAITNRYVPNNNQLQPLDSQVRRARATATLEAASAARDRSSLLSQGSSVDGEEVEETWSHQHRRERDTERTRRRGLGARIGSVVEDDDDDIDSANGR